MFRFWPHPEGVHVLPDGGWRVGGFAVRHAPSLRYMKAHLAFEEDGVFIAQGGRRIPVVVDGPPFEVAVLVLDPVGGEAHAVLDDGSEEPLGPDSLSMNERTGQFECRVRGGRSRAVFSRGAHQKLLENIEEDDRRFYLRVGARRIPIRT